MSAAKESLQTPTRIGVLGIGSYLPSHVITNDVIAGPAGVTEEWIVEKTGIETRRRVKPDEATSDLALYAARAALEDAGVQAADLSLVIVGTATPDVIGPPVASAVALALECPQTTGTFDIHAACSGFLTAITMAEKQLRVTGGYALVIGADSYSRFLNPADRRTAALWGDGAGAVVLGAVEGENGRVLATKLMNAAVEFEVGGVMGGGSRQPASYETVDEGLHYVSMQGRRIRQIFEDNVPPMAAAFLEEAGVTLDDIDHVVPHQGNLRMVESVETLLGLTHTRLHATAGEYGNTGSASTPITLDQAVRNGSVKSGDTVLMFAIGTGMTFAFVLLRWK
ncbi:3-oxoacyl-ACP synthase III family protein [Streptomyces litchfieldiae]|uniref:Ketoacyl-ACP synthase III n=1 Tax=Streptomyces litchfieldiae TaxID=3075543 RepID=A0ABU2MVY9_9ACTN|nr:ketoacyl-ACP synthase III [Streptomyces sp. DSM 44938]MDT0345815.1 ketoacyl-ACP synthase III [Streptomyces sp. DSM 44938]